MYTLPLLMQREIIIFFRIEKRVEERKRKWEEDVENELKQQREAANFKARPARVLENEPFVSLQKKHPLCYS